MLSSRMPGHSFQGALPALGHVEQSIIGKLKDHVETLAAKIVDRNVFNHPKMLEAVTYLEKELASAGLPAKRHTFNSQALPCHNLESVIKGTVNPEQIIIIGAHYDSLNGCPGANDNASGVAATLVLAQLLAGKKLGKTVRFVLFANEEAPFHRTLEMGSWLYAKNCKGRNERIIGMINLETIGYYIGEEGSQQYPFPLSLFYPSTGNFIAFVGNRDSAALVKQVVGGFRKHAKFPSEGAALHSSFKRIGDSDHWSFWKEGFPALMVTDTAPFRYPHYHTPKDTVDKLDFEAMARITVGLSRTIEEMAGVVEEPALASTAKNDD
jgi:hypothetical protein